MSGDKIDIGVQYYYTNTGTPPAPTSSFNDVLNSLVNGLVTVTGGSRGTTTELLNSSGPVYGGLNNFLTDNDPNTSNKPKAYNAVQVENLYLRSQGITDYYRTQHSGRLPFSLSKEEDIPDYLQ